MVGETVELIEAEVDSDQNREGYSVVVKRKRKRRLLSDVENREY